MSNVLNHEHLEMLQEWHATHRLALEAQYLAAHPLVEWCGGREGAASAAAELRSIADGLFQRLMSQDAFGTLAPMPEINGLN